MLETSPQTALLRLAGIVLWLVSFSSSSATTTDNSTFATDKTKAIALARAALLEQTSLNDAQVTVLSAEPQTWPNSGLGCAAPDATTLQVITTGHAVRFKTPKGEYRVHVAGQRAVVCNHSRLEAVRHSGGAVPLRNLNQVTQRARADLARQLNVPIETIRVGQMVATEWRDSSMDCKIPSEAINQRITKGYRFVLKHATREYLYHTDMERVRACPPIAAE